MTRTRDTSDREGNPADQEVMRPGGRSYLVRAVAAGEPLRDYGISGTAGDLLVLLAEITSVGLRRWIKPGWTVGVFLDRPRRLSRLVHKERLPPTADPAQRITELCQQLSDDWRPKNL